jgi:hypothetical protein
MMSISFGGMRGHLGKGDYPPFFPTFGLGGSKCHLLGHGIILGGVGFGGVVWFDDDLTHINEGRLLHMKIWPLEAQHLPQEPQRISHYAKMSPLKGMT